MKTKSQIVWLKTLRFLEIRNNGELIGRYPLGTFYKQYERIEFEVKK